MFSSATAAILLWARFRRGEPIRFLHVYDQPPSFRDLERRWSFRLAVLQRAGRGAAFLDWLRAQPDWRVVFENASTAILTKR